MRLHIILGFASLDLRADPFAVYVGRDGEAARKAQAASDAARFEIVHNPSVIRKNNRDAAKNGTTLADQDREDERLAQEEYNEAVRALVAQELTKISDGHKNELQQLANKLAAAEADAKKAAAASAEQIRVLTEQKTAAEAEAEKLRKTVAKAGSTVAPATAPVAPTAPAAATANNGTPATPPSAR